MKLFSFGKNKDDLPEREEKGSEGVTIMADTNEDGTFGDMDNDKYDSTEEDTSYEVESEVEEDDDYIDPEDLNYDEYEDIVDKIEYDWTLISPSPYTITYLDANIVIPGPTPVKKDSDGMVLTIVCPPERIITICGFNQADIGKEEFHNNPNLYEVPHFLALRLADDNNVEVSPMTIVDISKYTKDGTSVRICREFYGDLSPTRDGILKKKSERYYFADTIVLQKGEGLSFVVHRPNADISKMDIVMMSDVFEKDE